MILTFPWFAFKMKCSACGEVGHMRTNKACPMFSKSDAAKVAPVQVAMTQEQEEQEQEVLEDQNLVDVVGTKLKLSKSLIEQ